jgi:hypothetical protein
MVTAIARWLHRGPDRPLARALDENTIRLRQLAAAVRSITTK